MTISANDITRNTHSINACYSINGIDYNNDIDTNGYNLASVVADMVDFWNDHESMAEPFEVAKMVEVDGDIEVTIEGKVYAFLDGVQDENRMDTIDIIINATPKA